jgi:hypothetical protein
MNNLIKLLRLAAGDAYGQIADNIAMYGIEFQGCDAVIIK